MHIFSFISYTKPFPKIVVPIYSHQHVQEFGIVYVLANILDIFSFSFDLAFQVDSFISLWVEFTFLR